MASYQCKVDISQGPGLKDGKLTVGRDFYLNCQGDFPKDLKTESLHFVLDPTEKYTLKLLAFEFRSPTEADLKVTSYKATASHLQNVQLSDGVQTLDLGPLQFELVSVLPTPAQQQPGQNAPEQPKPFGPIGPASIPIPTLYWALLFSVLGILLVTLIYKIFRIVQRKKLIAKLKEHDSAMPPGTEYFSKVRQLQRRNTVFFGGQAADGDIPQAVDELQTGFKRYLTRRFQVPALEWSDRLILKDLKKYHKKEHVEFGTEIKDLLHEFTQAQKDRKRLTETDALKISAQSQSLVEKIERRLR